MANAITEERVLGAASLVSFKGHQAKPGTDGTFSTDCLEDVVGSFVRVLTRGKTGRRQWRREV